MLVEDGEVFGAYPYVATNKRKKYAWFTDALWKCRTVFFYLKGRMGEFDFTELEDLRGQLRSALSTQVKIISGKRKGKIVIEYYSREDLDRITHMLLHSS